jgi:branched-chain amino acid transport system ATP-binding protein
MRISAADTHSGRSEYLSVRAMTAGYGAAPIINDVTLGAAEGEITCVIGPNGAGKSTLLKTLTGRLKPVSGQMLLNGVDVTGATGDELTRAGLGYVPQTHDVFNSLTARENLEMGGYLLPKARLEQRIDEVLVVFPTLKPLLKRTAKLLSGGERKLLAIGRCLVLDPRVMILDEPTANLSPSLARTILRDHVPALARVGTSVLLVEQKAIEALQISQWCYVLVAGRVEISSAPEPLLAREDFGELFLGRRAASAVRTNRAADAEGPRHGRDDESDA